MSGAAKKDASGDGKPAPMSSQMQAVVRLLAGQEERTIAQKLADSNRPTWEDYKKQNEEHLNLEGMDQKKMEEYRAQLDKEREKRLARGRNHKEDKKKKSSKKKKKKKSSRRHDDSSSDSDSSDDDSEDSRDRRHRHKHKRKRKRKRHHHKHSDSSSYDSESSDERRKHKRKKKRKKESSKKDDGNDSDGSHYRLSKFFDDS